MASHPMKSVMSSGNWDSSEQLDAFDADVGTDPKIRPFDESALSNLRGTYAPNSKHADITDVAATIVAPSKAELWKASLANATTSKV
jgi:hypothetical protein